MKKARALVRHLGGAERCNSFTNFSLAALGQASWNAVPAIPPEIVFLPKWSPFHLDKVSAWSRTMILPLAIVATKRPTRELPATLGIGELFVDHDAQARVSLLGVGLILAVIALGTNYAGKAARTTRGK